MVGDFVMHFDFAYFDIEDTPFVQTFTGTTQESVLAHPGRGVRAAAYITTGATGPRSTRADGG
jgi:hypothetical protein